LLRVLELDTEVDSFNIRNQAFFKERIIELKTIYASRFGIRYQSDSFNIRGYMVSPQ